ncbi:hypothetical protein [Salinifilum ghardaiensis]
MPVERRAWGSGELGRRYLIAAVLAVPAGVAGALVTVALLRATHALSDRSPGERRWELVLPGRGQLRGARTGGC